MLNVFLVTALISTAFAIVRYGEDPIRKPNHRVEKLPWQELETQWKGRSDEFGRCPSGATGRFHYPPDCKRFLNCWKGRGHIQICAPGTLFNPTTRECDHPSKVKCADEDGYQGEQGQVATSLNYVRFPGERPPIAPNSRLAQQQEEDEDSGSEEERGYTGRPPYFGPSHLNRPTRRPDESVEENAAGRGYTGRPPYFGPSHLNRPTRRPDVAKPKADQPVECAPGSTGHFPHPTDCRQFLHCWSGRTFVKQCGPGTAFNPAISVCDHIYNVKSCGYGETSLTDDSVQIAPQREIEGEPQIPAGRKVPSYGGKEDQYSLKHPPRKPKIKFDKFGNPIAVEYIHPQQHHHHHHHEGFNPTARYPPQAIGKEQPAQNSWPQGSSGQHLSFPLPQSGIGDPQSNQHGLGYPQNQQLGPGQTPQKTGGIPQKQPARPGYAKTVPQKPETVGHQTGYYDPNVFHNLQKNPLYPQTPQSIPQSSYPYNSPSLISDSQTGQTYPSYPQSSSQPSQFPPYPQNPSTPSQGYPTYPGYPVATGKNPEGVPQGYPQSPSNPAQNYPAYPQNQVGASQGYPESSPTYSGYPKPTQNIGKNPEGVPQGYPQNPSNPAQNYPTYPQNQVGTSQGYPESSPTYSGYPKPTQNIGKNPEGAPQGYPQSPSNPAHNYPTYPQNQGYPPPASGFPAYPQNTGRNPQGSQQNGPLPGYSTYSQNPPPAYPQNPVGSSSQIPPPPSKFPSYPQNVGGNPENSFQRPPSSPEPGKYPHETSQNPQGTSPPQPYPTYPQNPPQSYPPYPSNNSPYPQPSQPSPVYKPQPTPTTQIVPNVNPSRPDYQFPSNVPGGENDGQVLTSIEDGQFYEAEPTIPPKPSKQPAKKYQPEPNPPGRKSYGSKKTPPKEDDFGYEPLSSRMLPDVENITMKSEEKPAPPSGQNLRLRGGSSALDGYLEIRDPDGQWGLACDQPEGWNIDEATIVCRELGYNRGAKLSWQGYPMKPGAEKTRVSVDQVQCQGGGDFAEACNVTFVDKSKCEVGRSAIGVSCYNNVASTCQPGEIHLSSHCYSLEIPRATDAGRSLFDAAEVCYRKGGHLLDLNTQTENDFISEWLLRSYPNITSVMTAGVGVTFMGMPMWVWQGTDAPMLFQRWWTGWSGERPIPQGRMNEPACLVMKRKFPCPVKNPEKREEIDDMVKPHTDCVTDYFFWDAEACKELVVQNFPFVCERPMSDIGCVEGRGEAYTGTANTTATGKPCLPWDHPKVIQGLARRGGQERSAQLTGHNYCRNVGKPDRHPWCFVEGSENSEYCDIPHCYATGTAEPEI